MFPVGTVEEGDTWERFSSVGEKPFGEEDKRFRGYYGEGLKGPEKYRDAPIALQLVGRRYREEELLGMVERVFEDLRGGN